MGASLGNGGGKRDSRRYRKQGFRDINITPMVDVMLVLLIIFMVAAPMLTTGVQVELPDAKSEPVQGNDEPLTITIEKTGKISLGDNEIKLEDLGTKLKAITGEKHDTRIFVRGDGAVDYAKVMSVVGEINAAGLTKVALITDSQGHEKPAHKEK
jgi:biopolymer transport protein TolR